MSKEHITNGDIWQFIQTHKNKTQDEFGSWLIAQSARITDKIVKAICAWNGGTKNEATY